MIAAFLGMGDRTALLWLASLLVLAIGAPPLGGRWPLVARVLWRVAGFGLLTVLVQMLLRSPFAPVWSAASPGTRLWEQLIEAGLILSGALVAVDAVRFFVVLEHRPRETKIVSDLLAGAIYVCAALAIASFAFELPIRGLLATSGVIAIVLGLALQSTLADVFSGIAVGLERPYKQGDLLWVEGGIEGRVVEVNWRATQIATAHDNIAIVPNSVIAKSRLVNRSAPTTMRGDAVTIALDASVPPATCIATLTAASRACRRPLSVPRPSVACTSLKGDGNVYEIAFTVASSAELTAARNELFEQMHRHLRHAGIALAIAGRARPLRAEIPDAARILAESDMFGAMDPAARDALASHVVAVQHPEGTTLIREGETVDGLFVVTSGTIEVTRREDGAVRLLRRLGPGETIGLIGLVTGLPTVATATTLTPVTTLRLDRDRLKQAVVQRPELAGALEAMAEQVQTALRIEVSAHSATEMSEPAVFSARLRQFLRRLAT